MIETPRLLLREWRDEDLEPFSLLNADERVCKFLGKTFTPQESRAMVERNRAHFQEHGFGMWAVEVKHGPAFIGYTGLRIPSFQAHFTPCVEIGWRLAYEYWGKGYATEAAKVVLNHAFTRLGIGEIVSFTVPKNRRSRAVMEKIGMRRDLNADFDHPKLPPEHHLSRHILYRVRRSVTAELPAHKVERPGSATNIVLDMSRTILIEADSGRVLSQSSVRDDGAADS